MVVIDRKTSKSGWLDWAKGCYIEYPDVDSLISAMREYLKRRNNHQMLADLEKGARESSLEMCERTSFDKFKELVVSLIEG